MTFIDSLPKVAVLLSTYNGEKFLKEQIESILNQKDVQVHLYIRDDGSTDRTLDIAKEFIHQNNVFLTEGKNIGPALSYLSLVAKVNNDYEYFSFSDQDDIWLQEKLFAAISKIKDFQSPALYCSALRAVDSHSNFLFFYKLKRTSNFNDTVYFQNFATGNTIVLNKPALELVQENIENVNCIMHDWWIAVLICSTGGSIYYDSNSYILYRQHENNVLGLKRYTEVLIDYFKISTGKRRILSVLQQVESLLIKDLRWKNITTKHRLLKIIDNRKHITQRLRIVLTGSISARTLPSRFYLSIMYLLFGKL